MHTSGRVAAQAILHAFGKTSEKVVAVFGVTPEACHSAVLFVSERVNGIPIWLFTVAPPLPETRALCERVFVRANSLSLLAEAEARLWPRWVALTVGTWTGQSGAWPVKLAPFLIPPGRALLMNEHGGFLSGVASVLIHLRTRVNHTAEVSWNAAIDQWHAARNTFLSGVRRIRDLSLAYWLLISYHIWRSGPCRRAQDLARAYWLLLSHHIWRSGPCRRAKDVLQAFSLLAIATLLKWCRYPQRRWFARLHGSEPLRIPVGCDHENGILPIVSRAAHWSAAEVESAVLVSTARWIVWSQDTEPGPIDDLLPLFGDERTFAVARQCQYRGGKPSIVPMAPFRTLQPGEACPVLAPLSPLIVIDRCKLASLGIPRSSMAASAWLILYWKAAAAGWRSYCVGHNFEVPPQPDFPVHEAAFFLHVLAKAEIRRLAPREPDLTRGTISFSAATRRHRLSRDGLRVLIVSPFLPYPLSHGGAVRIYNLCRALRGRVDFILAAIRENGDRLAYDQLHEVFHDVRVVDMDELPSRDSRLPTQVRHHQSKSLTALIRDLSREYDPQIIQIEYTHMAGFRDAVPRIPAILVEHDLTSHLYRQLARQNPSAACRREYELWRDFERRQLRRFDAIWTVSEDDRGSAVREGSQSERTFTVPNGVDTRRFTPVNEFAASPEILYVGSFRHLPNILGFERLCREVMPEAWRHFPNLRLRVVAGPQHEAFWQKLRPAGLAAPLDGRVVMHGFVDDLRPLYSAAWTVVVPLEVSAGTNIKVLEAMACGKAVVSTPVGCAGLGLRNDRDLLIRSEAADFARGIGDVISNPDLRARLGWQARVIAEKRFSWESAAEAAYESYAALTAGPPRIPDLLQSMRGARM